MRKVLVIISILLCLGACVPGHNDYSDFRNIDVDGWSYGDTLEFHPVIGDSTARGVLTLALRHSNSYLYSNLWLEVSYFNDTRSVTDTLNVPLADIYGRWYGSGFGARYQVSDTVALDVTLHRDKPIRVRHIMRADTLRGIEQVGLNFIPHNFADKELRL